MKNILLKHLLFTRRSSPNTSQSGFSLIELMVITVMIGVLSSIAAVGWEAFTTRQRIRAVNDQVFQALREAQSDAKLKKETRAITFYSATNPTADPPELSIAKMGPDPNDTTKTAIIPIKSINLSLNGSIKPKQILVKSGQCTNVDCTTTEVDPDLSLFFNYLGAVEKDPPTGKTQLLPFFVTTSNFDGKGKRCIIVETLLGGMRSAQGSNCP